MTYFFTSDLHFDHTNIIAYESRPYADVDEMNELLISNYNNLVEPYDVVFFLGDVFLGNNQERNKQFLARMKGVKILIMGNHDRKTVTKYLEYGFYEVHKHSLVIYHEARRLTLRHRPDPESKAGFVLHGHVHGKERRRGNNIHVGVDAWDYNPVSEHSIVSLMVEAEREQRARDGYEDED